MTEIGIIYNPVLNQKFTARRGQGSFYNGKPAHASGETDLSKALVTSEFGTSRDPERVAIMLENIGKMIRVCHG